MKANLKSMKKFLQIILPEGKTVSEETIKKIVNIYAADKAANTNK